MASATRDAFLNHFTLVADVFLNAQNKYTVQHPYILICNLKSWLNFFSRRPAKEVPKWTAFIIHPDKRNKKPLSRFIHYPETKPQKISQPCIGN